MAQPVIALVGQPNVGKSTLFNRLSKSKNALVCDFWGLTRDRQYAQINLDDQHLCQLIDTAGLTGKQGVVNANINAQIEQAITEADLIFFLVSAREEINQLDKNIAQQLRKTEKNIILLGNKSESLKTIPYQFYELGLGEPLAISAEHGLGIEALCQKSIALIDDLDDQDEPEVQNAGTLVSIVGRPNVGKSTLINRLINKNRLLVLDMPGTTRDSIYIPFSHHHKNYTLIDTAGIRRKRSVKEKVEIFSIVKTIQAIEKSHVVLLMFDAQAGITNQDASLLGLVTQKNKPLILVINKWDSVDHYQKQEIKRLLKVKLTFVDCSIVHYISALDGRGVHSLYSSIDKAARAISQTFATSYLNKLLTQASQKHPPSLFRGRRIRLKFINQTKTNPLTFSIYGSQVNVVPTNYERYLTNFFKKSLNLGNIPIVLEFKNSTNPYGYKKSTAKK